MLKNLSIFFPHIPLTKWSTSIEGVGVIKASLSWKTILASNFYTVSTVLPYISNTITFCI